MNSRPDMLTLLFLVFVVGFCITGYSQSDVQLFALIQSLLGAVG